jgi:hypothetical protein
MKYSHTFQGIEIPTNLAAYLEFRVQDASTSPTGTPREKCTLTFPALGTTRHMVGTLTQFTSPQSKRLWRAWYYPTESSLGTYASIEAARAAMLAKVAATVGLRKAGAVDSRDLTAPGAPKAVALLGWPLPQLKKAPLYSEYQI